jgi:hypothetical protein
MKKLLEEIDDLLTRLENYINGKDGDDITEMRYKIREALKQPVVSGQLPQSDTCPKCSAYDWSYHAGIEKMKCGDCGHRA